MYSAYVYILYLSNLTCSINYYRIHALASYASPAKIINHTANFVFIVGRNIGLGTFKTWWPPETREKRLYLLLLLGSDILCMPSADPPKYYYLVGFLRFGNHDQSGPLYDPMSSTPNAYTYIHIGIIHTYMLYFIHLFYCYIIILLYSTYNILSLRGIGAMGKVCVCVGGGG